MASATDAVPLLRRTTTAVARDSLGTASRGMGEARAVVVLAKERAQRVSSVAACRACSETGRPLPLGPPLPCRACLNPPMQPLASVQHVLDAAQEQLYWMQRRSSARSDCQHLCFDILLLPCSLCLMRSRSSVRCGCGSGRAKRGSRQGGGPRGNGRLLAEHRTLHCCCCRAYLCSCGFAAQTMYRFAGCLAGRLTAAPSVPVVLQVSRDEVREAVLAGSLPPPLQAVGERREAQQAAVRALVAAAAAGDEARLKVGGAAAGCGVVWCVVHRMKAAFPINVLQTQQTQSAQPQHYMAWPTLRP